MRLKDRVAIITGAGNGIGEATALKFSEDGAKVVLCDIDEPGGKRVADLIKSNGKEALFVKADVGVKTEVAEVVKQALEKFGKLDILINNAGINRDALAKKMTEEQWDLVMNVNLKGTFLCAQLAIEPMSAQNYGRIVNTASIGVLGNIGQANYAASKCGVIGLTKTLALELARYNITVNCVAPGGTNTPMTAKMPQDIAEKFRQMVPLRRFAEPVEIANAHLFFASDEASYITGQVLFVDGGLSVGI
jgi:NAD(P)-dependent dehydrogenase (short-subunit alcohol dehydrogenase family)